MSKGISRRTPQGFYYAQSKDTLRLGRTRREWLRHVGATGAAACRYCTSYSSTIHPRHCEEI